MDKSEALSILKDASWTYTRRVNPAMPFPAAITDYPGINEEILELAGLDVSGENGNGVAVLEGVGKEDSGKRITKLDQQVIDEEDDEDEELPTRYVVFGRENMHYMNEHGINFGQENGVNRLGFPTDDNDGGILAR